MIQRRRRPRADATAGLAPVLVGASLITAACLPGSVSTTGEPGRTSVLEAADRRGASTEALRTLLGGSLSAAAETRADAALGMGRQQRLELGGVLVPLLADPVAQVRREAVVGALLAWSDALSYQSGSAVRARPRRAPIPDAAQRLLDAVAHVLRNDSDPTTRGLAATALGRVPWPRGPYADMVAELREQIADAPSATAAEPEPVRGMVRGLATLLGRPPGRLDDAVIDDPALGDLLVEIATEADDPLTRRYAVSALTARGRLPGELVDRLLADPDAEVRRLTLMGDVPAPPEQRARWLSGALEDGELRVRLAALGALRWLPDRDRCDRARAVLEGGRGPHERIAAIARLQGCDDTATTRLLAATAEALHEHGPHWHLALAALGPWAERERPAAEATLMAAAEHPAWQVRAGAASLLADPGSEELAEAFERLLYDAEPNVRTAALTAALEGGNLDRRVRLAAREALEADEYELTMVAARALAAGRRRGEAGYLLDALERITERGHDTSRDPRLAILDSLGELRRLEAPRSARLEPFLADFDPVVAARTAAVLERHTRRPHRATPTPRPPAEFPSDAELRSLAEREWVVTVHDRGVFVIRLWPWRAPTNAARFARLADAGAFEGLTFHRVVPNFVVQGLSPGGNEYAGYPRYTRDELTAHPHLRGTVGLSTRGRDTGDGQIFVNLVDNYRLDFDYTLFGEVVEGMEVVESLLAGAVIESVRARPRGDRTPR